MAEKWTIVAYVLWLLFGFFGVHHFYLGRDRQGILWLTSFAGIFGLGWLVDFGRIPTYVSEANPRQAVMEMRVAYMNLYGSPPICSNLRRIVAQVLFGYFYRMLVYCAIPGEVSSSWLIFLLAPLGTAFGTYMVSNVGRIKSHYLYAAAGAYVGEFLFGEPRLVGYAPLFAAGVGMLFSTFGWKHRERPTRLPLCQRLKNCLLFYGLFILLLFSGVYYNATVETDDGETIRVREAVSNFFNSEAWLDVKTSFGKIYIDFRHEGWEGARRRFINLADVNGEDGALRTLDLEEGVSMQDVKTQYQILVKKWHPDHNQGASESEKEYAQQRFIEIQKAYEILRRLYGRTKRSNL